MTSREKIQLVFDEMGKVVVGHEKLTNRLLIGLFTGGHVLLEGVPGLAKTLAINTLSKILDLQFHRIQFTPDLLPADLIGTLIYSQKQEEFIVRKGPIFANFVLADEINRSPAKVQSALLEAMQEKQVTIGAETHKLPRPFLVLATQNPIEQEGTYPLPEAQMDRFMMKVIITYPRKEEERMVVRQNLAHDFPKATQVLKPEEIIRAKEVVKDVPQWWKTLFAPVWKIAVYAVLVLGIGFGIWRMNSSESDVVVATKVMSQAYHVQRPLETRITGFDYAPFPKTLGNSQDGFDPAVSMVCRRKYKVGLNMEGIRSYTRNQQTEFDYAGKS